MRIIPVVLCGGSGTRLWPVSRRDRPKQFIEFSSTHSLLQQTLLRCKDSALFHEKPIIVGSVDHRFLISEALEAIGVAADIILEPRARNSCAAITAACLYAQRRTDDAVVLVLAADHYIPDHAAFAENVTRALDDAMNGHLVTFGIKPNHPATGYGYISPGERLIQALKIEKFVEKPDTKTAQKYLKNGFLWNSGNFLFQASSFCQEMQKFEPEILANVTASIENGSSDSDAFLLEDQNFSKAKSISIDYAIMEHSTKAAVLPVDYQWLDIGNWAALANMLPEDQQGNAVKGNVELLESSNNLVYSDHRLTTVIGMQDTIVVATRDAVLVVPKNEAEKVKNLVNLLEEKQHSTVSETSKIIQTWENDKQLDVGPPLCINRIVLKSGKTLPQHVLAQQAHHWVVVEGVAEVTIDDDIKIVEANHSIYIPQGAIYRLANRQNNNLVLIEIQIEISTPSFNA